MLDKVLQNIRDFNMLKTGERVVCGFSGGADSTCLLHVMLRVSEILNVTVTAAHLNHMLRGEESLRDERFAKKFCKMNGIDIYCERVDINSIAKKNKISVELAARNERYAFFERAAEMLNAQKIATAHNAQDSLETILINLSRGTGLKGLCGIPPVRDKFIRPIITATRQEILNYLTENNISFIEDSTNKEDIYSRNRIRRMAIPAMQTLNKNAIQSASRSSMILREEEDFLQAETERITAECKKESNGISFSAARLLSLHPALMRRVILLLAVTAQKNQHYSLEYERICDIILLARNLKPSARLNLPGGLSVRREYDRIYFELQNETINTDTPAPQIIKEGDTVEFGSYIISCRKALKPEKNKNSLYNFYISCDKIDKNLWIRKRTTGDKIKLPGRPEKTLKRLMIEQKVPALKRCEIPVLADESKVIAVYGIGLDERFTDPNPDTAYCITIREKTEN